MKVHYSKVSWRYDYRGWDLPLCWPVGSPASELTQRKAKVTCKVCLRLLGAGR